MHDSRASAQRESWRPARIALIEDDDEMRILLAATLLDAGYDVSAYRSGLDLLERLDASSRAEPIDLVISDVRMPGVSGLCLLEGIGAWGGDPPPRMILITAFGDAELHARAHRFGAITVLDKPFAMDDLLLAAGQALEQPDSGGREPGSTL